MLIGMARLVYTLFVLQSFIVIAVFTFYVTSVPSSTKG